LARMPALIVSSSELGENIITVFSLLFSFNSYASDK
jgi:hypothetical protein